MNNFDKTDVRRNNRVGYDNRSNGNRGVKGKDRGGCAGKRNRKFSGSNERNYKRGEKYFTKFVDERNSNFKDNRNSNYHSKHRYFNNSSGCEDSIIPWQKNKVTPLMLPAQQLSEDVNNQESIYNDKNTNIQNTLEPINESCREEQYSISQGIFNENQNLPNTSNNNFSSTNNISVPFETSKTVIEPPVNVKIKQEKQEIKLKQEKETSSSSSSSDSSSESEPESCKQTKVTIPSGDKSLTTTTPIKIKGPSSPDINLKPKTREHPTSKIENEPTSSSSSSSSSNSDEEPPPSPKQAIEAVKIQETKFKLSKKKNSSEDEVVCIGNLENNIVLEDESNDEDDNRKSSKSKTKKLVEKTEEICVICDKKGHTSFQCQMICKNCSEPYHGYRTCPKPPNLNLMLQLFMEFCMQQLQHFRAEKQLNTDHNDGVPKPQIDSPSTTIVSTKSNNLKRKAKSNRSDIKAKISKKRKLKNIKKNKFEDDGDNEDDDDNSEVSSFEYEKETTDSDNTSSSSKSSVSLRKRHKKKKKNNSVSALNLSNFSSNPVNLPLVLNGFPSLTTGSGAVTNANTSANALNTLLLTQMFQNAIGSLK